jgi:protein PhnA
MQMSRGLNKHKAHQEAINRLGRPLARRARSCCELCGASGTSLKPFEVPPAPPEPELETTLLLCHDCHAGADGGPLDPKRWRFLENAIWAELPAAQVTAVRLVRRLADQSVPWASQALDGLYLPEEIQDWVERA